MSQPFPRVTGAERTGSDPSILLWHARRRTHDPPASVSRLSSATRLPGSENKAHASGHTSAAAPAPAHWFPWLLRLVVTQTLPTRHHPVCTEDVARGFSAAPGCKSAPRGLYPTCPSSAVRKAGVARYADDPSIPEPQLAHSMTIKSRLGPRLHLKVTHHSASYLHLLLTSPYHLDTLLC